MWAAFVRNRDTQNGPIGMTCSSANSGQGLFHWGRFFDDDHTPMDYDGIDWEALGGNQFQSHTVADEFYAFCPLDLYLMGLIDPSAVGSFYVIQNPSGQKRNHHRDCQDDRDPERSMGGRRSQSGLPNTQKVWKQAFVVLTKNAAAAQAFVQQVAQQRRAFSWQFYKATRFLGRVDTTLARHPRFHLFKTSV